MYVIFVYFVLFLSISMYFPFCRTRQWSVVFCHESFAYLPSLHVFCLSQTGCIRSVGRLMTPNYAGQPVSGHLDVVVVVVLVAVAAL